MTDFKKNGHRRNAQKYHDLGKVRLAEIGVAIVCPCVRSRPADHFHCSLFHIRPQVKSGHLHRRNLAYSSHNSQFLLQSQRVTESTLVDPPRPQLLALLDSGSKRPETQQGAALGAIDETNALICGDKRSAGRVPQARYTFMQSQHQLANPHITQCPLQPWIHGTGARHTGR